jgi:hypothetical protein
MIPFPVGNEIIQFHPHLELHYPECLHFTFITGLVSGLRARVDFFALLVLISTGNSLMTKSMEPWKVMACAVNFRVRINCLPRESCLGSLFENLDAFSVTEFARVFPKHLDYQ